MSSLRGESGRTVECPACGAANTVPCPGEAEADLHSQHEEIVKFFCEHCEQKLSSPVGLAGRVFDCPNCGAENTVPGEPPAETATPVDEDVVKFYCCHCGQKLACDPAAAGKMIDCPVCAEPTAVPARSQSPLVATSPKIVPLVPKPPARMTPPPKKPLPPPVEQSDQPLPPPPLEAPKPVARPTARIRPPEVGEPSAPETPAAGAAANDRASAPPPDSESPARAKSGAAPARKRPAGRKTAKKKAARKKAAAKKRAPKNTSPKEAGPESPSGPKPADPEDRRPQRPLTKAEEMSAAREALKESLRAEAQAEAERTGDRNAGPPEFPLRPPVPMTNRPPGPASGPIVRNRTAAPVPGAGTAVLQPVGPLAGSALAVAEPPTLMKNPNTPTQNIEPLRLTDPASGANRTILPPPRSAQAVRLVPAIEEDFELTDMEPVRLTELMPVLPDRRNSATGSELAQRVSDAMDPPAPTDPFASGPGG